MQNGIDIVPLRKRINELDAELVRLLNERAATALAIGKVKAQTGAKVYDPSREREILDHIDELNQGPLSKGAVEEVFTAIITVCREIQNQ